MRARSLRVGFRRRCRPIADGEIGGHSKKSPTADRARGGEGFIEQDRTNNSKRDGGVRSISRRRDVSPREVIGVLASLPRFGRALHLAQPAQTSADFPEWTPVTEVNNHAAHQE
jgi:hypothetical protein